MSENKKYYLKEFKLQILLLFLFQSLELLISQFECLTFKIKTNNLLLSYSAILMNLFKPNIDQNATKIYN